MSSGVEFKSIKHKEQSEVEEVLPEEAAKIKTSRPIIIM
jgi:hypothetical protein